MTFVAPTLRGRVAGVLIRHGAMTCDAISAALNEDAGSMVDTMLADGVLRFDGERFELKTPREQHERQVMLHDGSYVGSWSEEWRAECEARGVLRMPTKMARQGYILRVRQKRGDAAANALEDRVMAIWKAQREQEQWCG
jgi:hypothetical protein